MLPQALSARPLCTGRRFTTSDAGADDRQLPLAGSFYSRAGREVIKGIPDRDEWSEINKMTGWF